MCKCDLLLVMHDICNLIDCFTNFHQMKGRPGVVVRAVSLSHQVVGSKQPLYRFASGRLASVFPFLRPHSCGSLRHWVCPL